MSNRTRPPSPSSRPGRAEDVVQVGIMLAVGGMAGAASFSHVQSLAESHGQDGWLSWAIAVSVELLSVASGLEVRRQRRLGQPYGLPMAVLIAAVGLSLAAQVAEAERSLWGWVLAAWPAVAFLAITKIVLGRAPVVPVVEDQPAPVPAARDVPVQRTAPVSNAVPTVDEPAVAVPVVEPVPVPVTPFRPVIVPDADLVQAARTVADELADSGRRVTRDALAAGLRDRGHRVSTGRATELARDLAGARTNGRTPALTGT